ncbi:MAG: hypothetical protein ACLT4C_10880 [Butyricicoccus sp.]
MDAGVPRLRTRSEFYASRQRPLDEVFPWDHIGCGTARSISSVVGAFPQKLSRRTVCTVCRLRRNALLKEASACLRLE